MKRFTILLFITICYCIEDKSEISISGNDIQARLPDSKERRISKRAKDEIDVLDAKKRAKVVKGAQKSKAKSIDGLAKFWDEKNHSDNINKEYLLDPVLNGLNTRRLGHRKHRGDSSESSSDELSHSSSRELKDWKDEWRELWLKRQAHALNMTDPGGDRVNMIAARPWGVPCGDPAQHDMPWGTCVLPAECDAEYRVYRGDYFCGRTQFICCSVAFTTYDNYQGFDVSLADSSMQTDSAEHRLRKEKADKDHKRNTNRDKKKRRRLREERKRKIKRTIRRIVREVKRILDRAYRNASKVRRKKTRIMKQFIRHLKRQYKKDRQSVLNVHEHNLFAVDNELYQKLLQIKDLNKDFMTNDTFRSILMDRKMSYKAARMLVDTYPQLTELVSRDITRRVEGSATPVPDVVRRSWSVARHSGNLARRSGSVSRRPRRRKYLDYDVEYGLMYS